jgi:hypothetical protein
MKMHKNHTPRSPYEPDQAVDPKNNPRHTRVGGRKEAQAEDAPKPKKKAAKKKAK